MITMTIRGLKLYFRNKGTVISSIMSVLIMFAIFALFLEQAMVKDTSTLEGSKLIVTSWIISGMLATTSISSCLGAYSIMVTDRDDKIVKDFYSSPMKRSSVLVGYIVSGLIVSIIMSLLTFIIGEIYLTIKGGNVINGQGIVKMLLVMILSSFSSSSIICFIISFVKKNSTYATVSVLLGTLIGFLTGTYLPIGNLPQGIQTMIKIFPPMHSASLFRQVLMNDYIDVAFVNASSDEILRFKEVLGITLSFSGHSLQSYANVMYLLISGFIFYVLGVINITRKEKSMNH